MSHKIAIIKEPHWRLPVGSVLQKAVIVTNFEGRKFWEGLHCSMAGSYIETVPEEYGEIWDEEKHDPFMSFLKKDLAEKKAIRIDIEERATLARLKLKYEKDSNGQ